MLFDHLNRDINIVFVSVYNMTEHRHLIQSLLHILSREYSGDYEQLVTDDRLWLLATHPLYGIVGGICVSPPNAPPAISLHNKQMLKFFQDINQHWIVSHLFFCEEEWEIKLSDVDLVTWHNIIFQKLYQALIISSIIDDLSTVILLIEQDLYANLHHDQLPFLHEQYISFGYQSFILSHLKLTPEDRKQAYASLLMTGTVDLALIDEEDQNTKVIH